MKYDDDELAEAALLLGHHLTHELPGAPSQMPASLEQKLLEQGRAIAAETRYTTTKAAALAVETEPPNAEPSNVTPIRAWTGWFAAAAAVAALVYGVRHGAVERSAAPQTTASPAAPAAPDLRGTDRSGAVIAELSLRGRSVEVVVRGLPANAPGEHYRLWLSSGDAGAAVPSGSFGCNGTSCAERAFTGEWGAAAPVQSFWITRNKESDPWTLSEQNLVLAEGHRGTL